MKLTSKLQNKTWIVIILAVLFYTIIIIYSDVNEIITEFNNIKLNYYLIILPLVALSYIIQSLRFDILLKKLDIKLPFKSVFIIYMAGSSMTVTPMGLGAIIKSHILKKRTGKSLSSTVPITIYEKWIDLTGIVITIGTLLYWVNYIESLIVLIVGILFVSFFFIFFKTTFGFDFLKMIISKIKFLKNFIGNVDEAKLSTTKLFSTIILLKTLPLSLLHKIIVVMIIFLIFKSFSVDLDLFTSGQIYFTSSIVGALSFIPGGIIVVEAGLLSLLLKNGIDLSIVSVLVLTIRFVTLWLHVIVGFLTLKLALTKQ